jgi:hypothetical protein
MGSSSTEGMQGFRVKPQHLRPHCAMEEGKIYIRKREGGIEIKVFDTYSSLHNV